MLIDPETIADSGTQIYAAKYQHAYEADYRGQFAAIDVQSEEAFVRPTPEEALRAAQAKNPRGMFHLVKIGFPGVFRVAYSSPGARRGNRILRRQR